MIDNNKYSTKSHIMILTLAIVAVIGLEIVALILGLKYLMIQDRRLDLQIDQTKVDLDISDLRSQLKDTNKILNDMTLRSR